MSKKIAYVTGGMGGIGTTMCQRLHQDGFTVIAGCGPSRDFNKWLDEQRALGFEFHASVGNVGDWDSTVAAFQKAKAEHGPIDVLVNNAGITRDGMFRKMSRADWDAVIETNLTSLVQRDQAGHRRHARKGLGPHHQHQFGQWREGPVRPDQLLGSQGRNARLHDGAGAGSGQQGRDRQHREPGLHCHRHGQVDPSGRARQDHRRHPGEAAGTPDDIASIVSWVASDESGFATGADFSVNGGLHMG